MLTIKKLTATEMSKALQKYRAHFVAVDLEFGLCS